jgi:hypothetical protein
MPIIEVHHVTKEPWLGRQRSLKQSLGDRAAPLWGREPATRLPSKALERAVKVPRRLAARCRLILGSSITLRAKGTGAGAVTRALRCGVQRPGVQLEPSQATRKERGATIDRLATHGWRVG